jgi:glyoxylase I family protein
MSKNLVKGIHHLSLRCKNLEKYNETINFYKNILGLTVFKEFELNDFPVTMLDTGAGIIEVFSDAKIDMPTGIVQHFALKTDDVDTCINAVQKAGYKITEMPKDYIINDKKGDYPIKFAFCIGPVGEILEFFCEK